MKTFTVIKSPTRGYGYSVQDTTGTVPWIKGPNHTCGWYRLKSDAQQRADVLNNAEAPCKPPE